MECSSRGVKRKSHVRMGRHAGRDMCTSTTASAHHAGQESCVTSRIGAASTWLTGNKYLLMRYGYTVLSSIELFISAIELLFVC